MLSDAEVPRLDPHHVIKHELQVQAALHANLCEHGFAVLGDHGALVAVQRHKVTVEGLLRVLQNIEQLGGAALKNTSKVSWDQSPADGVSFGSILQTEGDGEHGVILKELCGEGIPPEIVTVLCPIL